MSKIKFDLTLKKKIKFSVSVMLLFTLNESYNRPHYTLAASSENKNKKSMFFYTIEESLPKSLRIILLIQDEKFLKWPSPNKGTLVSESHIFAKF